MSQGTVKRLGVVVAGPALAGLCLLFASSGGSARAASNCSPATGTSETFTRSNGKPQLFGIPAHVTRLSVEAEGGHGGQKTDTWVGGPGGGVRATINAAKLGKYRCLTIYVGEYGSFAGGYGWAPGGSHGTIPGSATDCGHSGAGGGGASGIAFGPPGAHLPLVVAGGGGGGGGDGCHQTDDLGGGGAGGAGGRPAGAGTNGKRGKYYYKYYRGGLGGCGGCADHERGNRGQGASRAGGVYAGAGGGGGGGFKGGDGGKIGSANATTGGGGGGGGSSYAHPGPLVTNVHYFASERPCPYKREGAECNGIVKISWTYG